MLRNLWCFKFLKNPATSFITWWAACSQVTRWLVFIVTWSLYSWRMLLLFTKFIDCCFYILDNTDITNKYHLVTEWQHDLKSGCWKVRQIHFPNSVFQWTNISRMPNFWVRLRTSRVSDIFLPALCFLITWNVKIAFTFPNPHYLITSIASTI